MDYVEAHPDEANEIMARHVGGWLEDPAVFAETLKGVRFYDREKSGILRHPGRPGQIYQTSQYAIDVWRSLGVLKADLTPADVIRHDSGSSRHRGGKAMSTDSISPPSSPPFW